jgi:methyltransferase (TIGR00027 family)
MANRALSRKESEPRYRTRDHLAEYFLPWHYRFLVNWFPSIVKAKATKKVPAGLSWLIARTHIYDHLLESSLTSERDITQVVILGAGFDTRFLRLYFPTDRTIRLIEIDTPATQAYKRSIIDSFPAHIKSQNSTNRQPITYIPVDFEIDTIEAALLRNAAFNPTAKTFFIWEAVTPYLTENAVDNVLNFVRENSAPGSTLAFDVRYKEAITGEKTYTMSALTKTVGDLKEPFKFGVPEGTVRQWVASKGLECYSIYGPPQFAEYVTSDTSYSLECPDIMDLVVVKTPKNE